MGVISSAPGILLGSNDGQDNTQKRPVALSGTVPVKVSNENGPIKPGDAITSSSVPGVGMKATQPGHIVGIALTSFEPQVQEGYEGVVVGTASLFVNTGYHIPAEYFESLQEGETDGATVFFQNFVDLVLKVRTLVASLVTTDRLEVKNPYGITVYDTVTGEPYCVVSENGELTSLPGKCEDIEASIEPILEEEPSAEGQPTEAGTEEPVVGEGEVPAEDLGDSEVGGGEVVSEPTPESDPEVTP